MYIIKKRMYMYMYMWGCLNKYIRVATWSSQTKIYGSAPKYREEIGDHK